MNMKKIIVNAVDGASFDVILDENEANILIQRLENARPEELFYTNVYSIFKKNIKDWTVEDYEG
jgi:hypothetical protein